MSMRNLQLQIEHGVETNQTPPKIPQTCELCVYAGVTNYCAATFCDVCGSVLRWFCVGSLDLERYFCPNCSQSKQNNLMVVWRMYHDELLFVKLCACVVKLMMHPVTGLAWRTGILTRLADISESVNEQNAVYLG